MLLTSALLSRPKNMSEEIALAFANFCLASLDSDTGADTSAFLLLGSLRIRESDVIRAAAPVNNSPAVTH